MPIMSILVLAVSILAIFLFYKPDITQSLVLENFYTIGLDDTPELREIGALLELSPVLKVDYSGQGNFDVVFTQSGQ